MQAPKEPSVARQPLQREAIETIDRRLSKKIEDSQRSKTLEEDLKSVVERSNRSSESNRRKVQLGRHEAQKKSPKTWIMDLGAEIDRRSPKVDRSRRSTDLEEGRIAIEKKNPSPSDTEVRFQRFAKSPKTWIVDLGAESKSIGLTSIGLSRKS